MRQLRLVAVSEDGTHLILSGDDDEQLALRVDESLHAAIRGDRARLGQLEIQLESQLRPRDIQARIRAGDTVEAVAAVAGMTLDKVRRYAGPVLAEREHIAGKARQATVRRQGGEGPVRTLDAVVTESAGTDEVSWDAWRRDDGRWQVQCVWVDDDAEATALFSFDPSGRSVVPDDDAARIVAGERLPDPVPEPEPEFRGPARLSVVSNGHVETRTGLGDDLDDFGDDADPASATSPRPATTTRADVGSVEVDHPTEDPAASDPSRRSRRGARPGRPERRKREAELWADDSADDSTDEPTSERLRLSDIATRVEVEGPDDDATEEIPEPAEQPAPARKAVNGSPRSRRPSVPSWDEIMFGRRKSD
ncbi:MAG TPA: septation protein SepH [Jiangellaceae bacterium]|nr:septation protein SepH [Jiangellaceae bacterium]